MMNFYNKNRNSDRSNSLLNALQSSRSNNDVKITPFQPVEIRDNFDNNFSETSSRIGDLLRGTGNLYKGIQNTGLFKTDNTLNNSISSAINNEMTGNVINTSPISSAINFANSGSLDSDIMQGLKGTTNGALTGLSIGGPWGAAIGGLFGLGSSFLDNI